jgi:flagellar hook-associated protein 1 FlgK
LSLSNIAVNPQLAEDENKIATSASGESGDNFIASEISALMEDTTLFRYGTLSLDGTGFYQKIISWLGTEGDKTENFYETKSTLVEQIDSRRHSISSVSLDEELSKVTTYQNAYDASARVLSVVDSLLEGLIEELG